MTVLDASLWIDIAIRRKPPEALPPAPITVPGHFDAEVLNALRGLVRGRELSRTGADGHVRGLALAALQRVRLHELIEEAWRVSKAVSAYDAFYVALARRERTALFTADARLAAGAADLCDVQLVS